MIPIRMEVADLQAIFTINPVGVVIWERLDGTATLDEILTLLLDRYDAAVAEARTDLEAFIVRLAAARLIERLR